MGKQLESITLTRSLLEENRSEAVAALRGYFKPVTEGGFTGGAWDTFDPSGHRERDVDVFTADDVVSTSLLSVNVKGWAAHQILVQQRDELSTLLRQLPTDQDFVDLKSVRKADFAAAWALDRMLDDIKRVGPTTVSKLMARKRPRLIPVLDEVVRKHVFGKAGNCWLRLHADLNANGQRLHHHLVSLHREAQLAPEVSTLRVFDVLAWLDGSGNLRSAISTCNAGAQKV